MDVSMDVTLTRDQWGIGHVDAPSAEAAFWAQGWLSASDRIWQMEWDRRRALGRWAEVAGPAAVAEDRFFRRVDLASAAKRSWDALDETARQMATAYTRGVNAWLDGHPDGLPPEFDHHPAPPASWEPWHCLAVYQVRHLFMGALHRKLWRGALVLGGGVEVARAMVGDLAVQSPIVVGATPAVDFLADAEQALRSAPDDLVGIDDVDGASNSWAIHGTRTASGKPLLAGDPHRGIEFPNVYHQCHLRCDAFDVIGMAFPGVPGFPHFAHNASVAWCITHGMADDTDVFVERGAITAERMETIDVFGAEPVEVACATTERGPVVLGSLDGDGPVLSMAWTGLHGPDTTFNCLRPMLEAGSVTELEASVEPWVIPVNNLLTADVDGTISFRLRGRVVERPTANRWIPVPGDDEHAWTGLGPVPFDLLPRLTNPERGFLVTANNRTSDAGPYISLDFVGPARHDRIVELLADLDHATVDDMKRIHADTRSLVAPEIVARLMSGRPKTDGGRRAQELIGGWDHDLAMGSIGATVYSAVRRLWAEEVGSLLGLIEAEVGERGWPAQSSASRMLFQGASILLRGEGWRQLPSLHDDDEFEELLGQLLDRAAAGLTSSLGPEVEGWTWDRVHTMVAPHPLALARPELAYLHPPVDSVPGDGDTVRASSLMPATGERAATSSVGRYAFDLSDWDRSGWVVTHGVSGVRGSGHDLDQRPYWLACELVPMAYSPAMVAEVAASTEVVSTLGGSNGDSEGVTSED
ncbi:MAG: penicillin acylase family protein [Actinomycetia bacterium]|nr:penicillin acylase family protein [Actinomycetes bacterium]